MSFAFFYFLLLLLIVHTVYLFSSTVYSFFFFRYLLASDAPTFSNTTESTEQDVSCTIQGDGQQTFLPEGEDLGSELLEERHGEPASLRRVLWSKSMLGHSSLSPTQTDHSREGTSYVFTIYVRISCFLWLATHIEGVLGHIPLLIWLTFLDISFIGAALAGLFYMFIFLCP